VTDDAWNSNLPSENLTYERIVGPPTTVSGTGFFEYFLPLMTILGDIVLIHKRKSHPRLRVQTSNDLDHATMLVEQVLGDCEDSIKNLANKLESDIGSDYETLSPPQPQKDLVGGSAIDPQREMSISGVQSDLGQGSIRPRSSSSPKQASAKISAKVQLVKSYSTCILHVLHVLLHGKWDAVSMLNNADGWITSSGFTKCASHPLYCHFRRCISCSG